MATMVREFSGTVSRGKIPETGEAQRRRRFSTALKDALRVHEGMGPYVEQIVGEAVGHITDLGYVSGGIPGILNMNAITLAAAYTVMRILNIGSALPEDSEDWIDEMLNDERSETTEENLETVEDEYSEIALYKIIVRSGVIGRVTLTEARLDKIIATLGEVTSVEKRNRYLIDIFHYVLKIVEHRTSLLEIPDYEDE